MKVIAKLIKEAKPYWNKCLHSKFVTELVKGTISEKRMIKYIVEDTKYLVEFAKGCAYEITKCQTLKEIRLFYTLLGFINEAEIANRRRFLTSRNISEEWCETRIPDIVNQQYIKHMLKYCKNSTLLEGYLSLLPCGLSYIYIFNTLIKKYPNMLKTKYGDIIGCYVGPELIKLGKMMEQFADQIGSKKDKYDKLRKIFIESCKHEIKFWDMAYNKKLGK